MDKDFELDLLVHIMDNILDKTLGEIDVNNVFAKTITNPKVTGIAGDVIEQSVLQLAPDPKQKPDILVDGIPVEVKTTGIRKSKKEDLYEAKEPMSITAVSPENIVNEDFENSHFWNKIKRMLLVFYDYASDKTVPASGYAAFKIKGYEIYETSNEDKKTLMNDWLLVKNFIKTAQLECSDPTSEYYKLSSEINKNLVLIDTAPKWPHRPRFRFKRNYVSLIVQEYFGNKFEKIPGEYYGFNDIEKKCMELEKLYFDKSIKELVDILGVDVNLDKGIPKALGEMIILRMFGAKAKKMNQIELFQKFGLIGKSLTVSKKKTRTEDMKLFGIDFDEWTDDIKFEDSLIYDFFVNHKLICILFEEVKEKQTKEDYINNKFKGFKFISFSNEFIENEVFNVWNNVRDLVLNDKLVEKKRYNKNGDLKINKNGVISTEINFPKSKNNTLFLRGGGKDSSQKSLILNGIRMYHQSLWIKGKVIVDMVKESKKI